MGLLQVVPESVEVAKPISAAPPPKMRPIWKAVTMVDPKEAVPASTSVACCPDGLVKVSMLNFTSATFCVGGCCGEAGVAGADPPPQAVVNANANSPARRAKHDSGRGRRSEGRARA